MREVGLSSKGVIVDLLERSSYVPDMAEVLFATKLVNPQQTVKLNFVAPQKTGDYPFVCTFPGHWRVMNGILRVR